MLRGELSVPVYYIYYIIAPTVPFGQWLPCVIHPLLPWPLDAIIEHSPWHDIPAHFCDRIRFVALGSLCACQVVKFFVPLTKIWCAHAPTCPWKKFITSAMDTVTGTLTHCTLFHSIVGRGSEDSHNKDCTFRFRTHRPWPLWAAIPGSSWPSSAPRQECCHGGVGKLKPPVMFVVFTLKSRTFWNNMLYWPSNSPTHRWWKTETITFACTASIIMACQCLSYLYTSFKYSNRFKYSSSARSLHHHSHRILFCDSPILQRQ